MPDSLSWARKIEFEDLLERDARLLYQHCGEEVLLSVLATFRGESLYLDASVLRAMQRRFIWEKAGDMTVKDMALTLGVSREYIYGVLRPDPEEEETEPERDLFDDSALAE
jgi:hypothetical protein